MRIKRQRRNLPDLSLGFEKTDFVERELINKISLWILRILLNLGGHREFIDSNGYLSEEKLAYFLDIGKYVDMDVSEYNRAEVLIQLKNKLRKLQTQNTFTTSEILATNIRQISNLVHLNKYEEAILEFVILVKQYDILDLAVGQLGNDLNSTRVKKVLGVILDIPKNEIDKAFSTNSKLVKSSLVVLDKRNTTNTLDRKLDSVSDEFIDNMLSLNEDISVMLKDSVQSCEKSKLTIKDYTHISKDMEILVPYLKKVIATKQCGVNILFYGLPGTGKTELAKVLSSYLKTNLFEVSYTDEDGEPIDGSKRLKAYKTAQALLGNKKTLLMYDEAEDIFESNSGFFAPKRQKDKAWINRVLETNVIPTIWITNNIHSIDNALVRRFDMSIEIPIPAKSKREEIIQTYSNDLLNQETIEMLAKNENIAPALISKTAKVINSIKSKNSIKSFTHLLNNTLKAQGYSEIKKDTSLMLPKSYNPEYINTDIDLKELAKGINKHPNARICLYGVPGTGKSAFGKWIAEYIDKQFLLKKGSDLISKWVGETEKNIANAFREAKEEDAVLVFDEVDSFLQDRRSATNSWEVTQVNEMLVQMENFNGIFIATTNLMSGLDQASLRRFDMKLEFGYLQPKHAWKLFRDECKILGLDIKDKNLYKQKIQRLNQLVPGDFAAVRRQSRFKPLKSAEIFLERLNEETLVKENESSNKIGFI
ncbi:AAA family ATPase [Sulfurovum sp. AR]|uniref:AAA family ATPase n=1 Tax=Sulfurovum sp. AR TaxID=1165841 RepID=UPI00025C4CBF|nr:AAA family ATPase [Sulfurovum sp. AR]EIF51367.1 AAA ATPase [Sulfurovum sp. AR]